MEQKKKTKTERITLNLCYCDWHGGCDEAKPAQFQFDDLFVSLRYYCCLFLLWLLLFIFMGILLLFTCISGIYMDIWMILTFFHNGFIGV